MELVAKDNSMWTKSLYLCVKLFMNEVGKQLADLQISKGGNIIMVQVENEYGSFGID